eukprot:gene36708-45281_t
MVEETSLLNRKRNSNGFQHSPVQYLYLNCEKHGDICRLPQLDIQSYPAVVAFNFKFKETISRSSLWDDMRQEPLAAVTVESIKAYVHAHHFAPRPSPFFYEDAPLVTELSDLELLEAMQRPDQRVVAVFYVPWCAHCKQFVDRFQAIAHSVGKTNDRLISTIPNNSELATG